MEYDKESVMDVLLTTVSVIEWVLGFFMFVLTILLAAPFVRFVWFPILSFFFSIGATKRGVDKTSMGERQNAFLDYVDNFDTKFTETQAQRGSLVDEAQSMWRADRARLDTLQDNWVTQRALIPAGNQYGTALDVALDKAATVAMDGVPECKEHDPASELGQWHLDEVQDCYGRALEFRDAVDATEDAWNEAKRHALPLT